MTFVHAVIEGAMPGKVFVDDSEQPRTAVVCNDSGWCFVLGDVRRDLVATTMPELLEALTDEPTALFATTPEWQDALDPLFERRIFRNEYHFKGLSRGTDAPPAGFTLVPLDARIAAMFEGRVDPWVVRIWGGPERFAEQAFGFAVMRAGELAAFCTACAIGGGEAEVEIGTAEDWRRLGLATVAGAAFIRECGRRGLRPAWTCLADNEPSLRTAARLGFTFFRQVTGYPLDRAMRLREGRWRLPE